MTKKLSIKELYDQYSKLEEEVTIIYEKLDNLQNKYTVNRDEYNRLRTEIDSLNSELDKTSKEIKDTIGNKIYKLEGNKWLTIDLNGDIEILEEYYEQARIIIQTRSSK